MRQRVKETNERKKKKRMNERNVCEGGRERNVIALQLCMAVENPFYVLIASGEDVLVARFVHSRVYETIREKRNVERRWSKVKRKIEQWDTAR